MGRRVVGHRGGAPLEPLHRCARRRLPRRRQPSRHRLPGGVTMSGAAEDGGAAKSSGVVRACFLLRLKPGVVPEYVKRHSPVWPEMLRALKDSGWNNYSIFVRDGLAVGYLETDDLDMAQARMERLEVNARWQAASADLFASEIEWLPLVFNLEDQLQALGDS